MEKYNKIEECATLLDKRLYEISYSGRKIYHNVIEVNNKDCIIKTKDEFGSICTVFPSQIGDVIFVEE